MTSDESKNEPIYTDPEVGKIIWTLQMIYALDDAVSNQIQLRRPEGFVNPLQDLRNTYAADLKRLTAKESTDKKTD
ncbi:MAG: hypothetical protein PHC39_04600 [Proteiniphilum sp.]|nr:hypothetical protein [Proteiniphilum sp.]